MLMDLWSLATVGAALAMQLPLGVAMHIDEWLVTGPDDVQQSLNDSLMVWVNPTVTFVGDCIDLPSCASVNVVSPLLDVSRLVPRLGARPTFLTRPLPLYLLQGEPGGNDKHESELTLPWE